MNPMLSLQKPYQIPLSKISNDQHFFVFIIQKKAR